MMPVLSILGSAKRILLNPKVLIGVLVLTVSIYGYLKYTNLQRDLAVQVSNYIKAKQVNENNINTINSLTEDIKNIKDSRSISDDSYIAEIKKLKALIFELNKKPKYKKVIKIKTIRVPVIKEGKTIYVNQCEDIKVKNLDKNESKNSLLSILSGVGK